jgi:hypothetical protein
MRKERTLNVAKALASQLHVTEEAIDTALSEAAHLIDAYVTSRRAIHLSATVGGSVYEDTLKAMAALSTAQRCMTAAHTELTRLSERMGLDATAVIPPIGTNGGKDEPAGVTQTGRYETAPV